ncbi:MAG: hypothetical protein IPK82_13010 [Polyangiaceae bacterium]|nr:hypothetical protein [Polyangiaceae bacterium]
MTKNTSHPAPRSAQGAFLYFTSYGSEFGLCSPEWVDRFGKNRVYPSGSDGVIALVRTGLYTPQLSQRWSGVEWSLNTAL